MKMQMIISLLDEKICSITESKILKATFGAIKYYHIGARGTEVQYLYQMKSRNS